MIDLSNVTFMLNKDGTNTATLTRPCPICGKEYSITVNQHTYLDGLNLLLTGALIQNAFPTFTPDEREFLMTGICPTCWGNM